ncbi:MAG: hypothetical protein GY828_04800 [Candidatus Gracilibacteria bacterium]|nr:hypothetical protein [Candidatus Gracilibacteria bacterium]
MQESNIQIEARVLSAISESNLISNVEKINFLRYVGYMTSHEKKELVSLL